MKKAIKILSLITAIYTITTTSIAQADTSKSGLYVGVDALRSFAKHKYLAEGHHLRINGTHSRNESNGFGVNMGYKVAAKKAFIAPEIFYEKISNSAKDFGYEQNPPIRENSLNVDQRYGAKINVGYNFASKFNVFANIGMTNTNYTIKLLGIPTGDHITQKVAQFTMIYGAGLSYDINNNWSLKASYDWQQFNARYDLGVEKDRILLQTVKAGIAYKF